MTDHKALIAELRERAEWARAELNQAAAECFDKAADALEMRAGDHSALIKEAKSVRQYLIGLSDMMMENNEHTTAQSLDSASRFVRRIADALEKATKPIEIIATTRQPFTGPVPEGFAPMDDDWTH